MKNTKHCSTSVGPAEHADTRLVDQPFLHKIGNCSVLVRHLDVPHVPVQGSFKGKTSVCIVCGKEC